MGILASDTFSRANQSGWGTSSGGQVWSSARGAGTYNIMLNEGVNSANGGTFSVARIGTGTTTSTEVLVRVQPADTSSDIGTIARYVDNNNFYYGVFVSGTVAIGKDVSGTFTTLTSTSFSYSTSNFYWLKFNLVGTTLKLKAWQDGTSEPANWTLTTTDSSLSSGGYGLGSDATGSTSFDSLTVTDASLTNLATLAQDTFKVRATFATEARATFKIRAVLATLSRDSFKVRAVLATLAHSTFKIRAVLVSEAHATWKIRAVLATLSRTTFKIDNVLKLLATSAQATFKIKLGAVLTWVTRDNETIWIARDNDATWETRDNETIWKARD